MNEKQYLNLSEADYKAARKTKKIRITVTIILVLLLLAALVYWFLPKTSDIADSRIFSEETITKQAKQIIGYIEEENFEALNPLMITLLQTENTKLAVLEAKKMLSENPGSFVSWGTIYMTEVSQMGQRAAVIEISAAYENAIITYRLSFNEDMLLNGLYMR